MAKVVLVHGAWQGAWCWQRVLPALWCASHHALAVDLTGLGARRHLFRPDLGLADHIEDLVQTLEAEELQRVVLVGHSYGGMVITGAAQRCHERLSALVYLDAVVPLPGESWSSTHSPGTQADRRAQVAACGALAPPDPAVFGLAGGERDWVARRQVPHPGGCYDATLSFDLDRWRSLPRHFIDCQAPALPTIDASRARVGSQPGWQTHRLPTGHAPMVSMPAQLAGVLIDIASTTG